MGLDPGGGDRRAGPAGRRRLVVVATVPGARGRDRERAGARRRGRRQRGAAGHRLRDGAPLGHRLHADHRHAHRGAVRGGRPHRQGAGAGAS
ncbi:conserved hypothetical protein [Ricinus communis]|uniref:Uncharacterized protein n=1 Tax=Ricinus communis TaxID=3988 RepID=B9TIS3_RICCO|nr:conserved hypothetical protein [Ricinus communis]